MAISEEVRAAVVAALMQGDRTNYAIARELKISQPTVGKIKAQMDGADLATIPLQKRDEIGDLLVDSIRSKFAALRSIEAQFTDTQWLKKQSASELARAHSDLDESLVRILSACERSGGDDTSA